MDIKTQTILENIKESNDFGKIFQNNVLLLAGGTMALLLPFIRALNLPLNGKNYLIGGEIFLIASLIFSLVSSLLSVQIALHLALKNNDSANSLNFYSKAQYYIYLLPMLFYIIGLGIIVIFINKNLFIS